MENSSLFSLGWLLSVYLQFMMKYHMLSFSGLKAVESFFVLSGLVLSMSLLKKFQK